MVNLEEYVKSVRISIRQGLGKDARLGGNVVLELSTVLGIKNRAGLNIQIVDLESQVTSKQIQKIVVPLTLTTQTDKMEKT